MPNWRRTPIHFIHDTQLSTLASREFLLERHLVNQHGEGKRTWLYICPGDSNITKWGHHFSVFVGLHALFPTSALEGGYSHKGWVTPLCWHQDIRVQMAQQNKQQKARHIAKALWSWNTDIPNGLELQYEIKSKFTGWLICSISVTTRTTRVVSRKTSYKISIKNPNQGEDRTRIRII